MFGRCIVLLLLCGLSIGFSQMIRSKYICGRSDRFSGCYDNIRYRSRLYCPDHHVFLIADFLVLAINETDERTCCARTPENSCSAEFNKQNSFSHEIQYMMSSCPLSPYCYFDESYMTYGLVNLTNDCSATNFMFRLDYTCVTNSTIVNMTRPGVNTSMGEISLSYSRGKYPYFPKINESFFCSCEVTSPDDVPIYPTIFSLFFYVNKKYNTSLFIYSRKWNVSYDRDNYNVLDLYLSNKYRRLNGTVGPIYVVYTGKELPADDTVWINFKVLEGNLQTRCDGCKRGKHYPPTFEGSGVNGNGNGQSLDVSNKYATRDSANGFKIAFIILMVIMAILGVAVIIGFLCWRKRRKEQKSDQKGVTDPHLQGGGRERRRGRGREKSTATGRANTRGKGANTGNEVSQPAVVSEVYDKIDRSQTSVVYDNLAMENIYDN